MFVLQISKIYYIQQNISLYLLFLIFGLLLFIDNTINSWREVCKLGAAFPNLDSLILADCPITSLDVTSPDATPECSYSRTESECESAASPTTSAHHTFRGLKFLNINNTLLSSWEDIDRLSCFPNMVHLRIHGLPLFEVSHNNHYN